jgi:hypothetical protein
LVLTILWCFGAAGGYADAVRLALGHLLDLL